MTPSIEYVLDILSMKAEIAKLYSEIDRQLRFFEPGRYDYDLELESFNQTEEALFVEMKEKGRYLKFEIENNASKLLAGETVFSVASVKPISFSSRSLKRCPDSLK